MDKKKPDKKKSSPRKKSEKISNIIPLKPGANNLDAKSIEKITDYMGIFPNNRNLDAVSAAQDIMYDAWQAPTLNKAMSLAKKALSISPDCADAYTFFAELAETAEQTIEFYAKGVEAGRRALGPQAFIEDVGEFWGIMETRPFMRALAGLAENLWEFGCREEALEHYHELLRLNPNDNQGIRDILMPRLIELGRDEEAEKLYKHYIEDSMASWLYSRVLLDFRKHGDSSQTQRSLKAALKHNKHVPSFLLYRKEMPDSLPAYFGYGDENEAIIYTFYNQNAWKTSSGAMKWLAGKVK